MIAAFARAARVLAGAAAGGARSCDAARRGRGFIRDHALATPRRHGCCAATATATRRSTATPKTTRTRSAGCSSCSRPTAIPRGWSGRATLQAQQDALFWDAQDGGWFSTTGHDPSVLLRLKEDYDGAEPAASSVSVLNLLTLGAPDWTTREARAKAERTLARYGERAGRAARVIPMMLAGLSAWHAGRDADRRRRRRRGRRDARLRAEAARHYLPFAVSCRSRRRSRSAALAAAMPFVGGHAAEGRPRDRLRLPRLHLPRAGDDAGRRWRAQLQPA